MKVNNYIQLKIPALSQNEYLARSVVGALFAELNPTIEQLADVKTAVSEAVTNCIVHAYRDPSEGERGYIYISARLYDPREVSVEISDNGCGIENLDEAMKPEFTTDSLGERCGMGFLVMKSFTDFLKVKSTPGKGTSVLMRKILKP